MHWEVFGDETEEKMDLATPAAGLHHVLGSEINFCTMLVWGCLLN
jgi:hypothetical protein